MLIKISGADFSVNKIGTVIIPRDNLDSDTISILANYTKNLTITEQYGFDDLIIGLKSTGLWAKIIYAYFPCLAKTISEALFEAKSKTPISNAVNASSIVTTGYQLEDYGLKTFAWASGDGYSIVGPEYSYGINSNSLFMATVYKKVSTGTRFLASLGDYSFLKGDTPYILLGSATNGIKKTSSILTVNDACYVLIGNARNPANSNTALDIACNGTKSSVFTNMGTYVNPNLVCKKTNVACSGYGQYSYNTYPVSVQLMGKELTDDDITTLNNLLETFNNKLIA